jgi:regulator of protease activity HflC (stomatin/prohibitin superfamily)
MVGIIILIVVVLILIFANIKFVPQANAYVIQRFGVYRAVWTAGPHILLLNGIVDTIAKKVSLKEQVLDFPPQPVITKDNVTMQIDSVVFCKVFDPRLFTYGVENPMAGLQNLSATTLRSIIGDMELDATLTSREIINAKMQQVLDEATDAWGIKVTRVEIKNIMPPKEIEEVMTKQMRAERERRQTVLEAQAHQEAVVSRAEGDKKAKILAAEAEKEAQIALAEGKAKSIQLVYEAEAQGLMALNDAQISEPVLKLKGIEALKDVSDGQATKIYMPSDIANAVSSLGLVGESLGIGDATKIKPAVKHAPVPKTDPCISAETGKGGVDAAKTTQQIDDEMRQTVIKNNSALRPANKPAQTAPAGQNPYKDVFDPRNVMQ